MTKVTIEFDDERDSVWVMKRASVGFTNPNITTSADASKTAREVIRLLKKEMRRQTFR